jgi:hypothetical protein
MMSAAGGAASRLQVPGLFRVIVDEADSLLIDEAVTPLIISNSPQEEGNAPLYRAAYELAIDAAAEVVSRLPRAPESVSWIHAARRPVLMKTGRAREQLGWKARHTSRATLKQLVAARRDSAPVGR